MTKHTRLHIEALDDRCLPSFSPATSFPVAPGPLAVVTADFNNDGRLDLATSHNNMETGDGTVSVLLGNADGSFQPVQITVSGPFPYSLATGDFNADGKLDLATGGYRDLTILLGNGDGTFSEPVSVFVSEEYTWASTPADINAGDMNADGKVDLVVAYSDDLLGSYVSVLLGHGDGSFAAATTHDTYYGQINSPILADVNSDGKVDVAVAGWQMYGALVYLGNGDGTLQEPGVFSNGAGTGANAVAAGDFNADGKVDLITTNYQSNSVSMLLGNGDGTFRTAQSFAAGNRPQSATASDVNGDGMLDLVVANPSSTLSGDGTVSVLLGNGDGSLAGPISSATRGSPNSVVTADFNGDGLPDAATNGGWSSVAVMLNDGDWTPPPPPPPALRIGDRTVTEGNTGTVSATFTVTLSAASSQTVTVAYATGNGSASAGSDYQAASGTLTFAPGETSKTITVLVNGDRSGEPNETFAVNLSSASNATIADGQGVGTIVDDEPRISISDVSKAEGKKSKTTLFTFTVTLSAAYDQPVTLSFRTANGTATTNNNDYVAKTGTLRFAPGETTKTITIEVKGDSKREGNETFYLDLFTKNRGIGTILNDD